MIYLEATGLYRSIHVGDALHDRTVDRKKNVY